MRSCDGGRSWQRADGTAVPLPARPEDMDLLELYRSTSHEPMVIVVGQGCIGLDNFGTPYVFYISHVREAGEMILASPDAEGIWQKRVIDPTVTGFPDHRPKGDTRGRFVLTADGQMHLILSLYPLDHAGWQDGKPTETLKHLDEPIPVVKLTSSDFGATWSARQLDPPREGGLIQELNMERSSVHRPIKGREPCFIFFDGLSRYPEEDEVINTRVHLAPDG